MMVVSLNNDMTGATSGAGTAYSTEPREFSPGH